MNVNNFQINLKQPFVVLRTTHLYIIGMHYYNNRVTRLEKNLEKYIIYRFILKSRSIRNSASSKSRRSFLRKLYIYAKNIKNIILETTKICIGIILFIFILFNIITANIRFLNSANHISIHRQIPN